MTSNEATVRLRELASRIDAAPSVARRSAGLVGTVAAYLPGERIEGIRIEDGRPVEIHVVMSFSTTVDQVETDVLNAVGSDWGPGAVDIVVDDIELPSERSVQKALPSAGSETSA